MRQRPEILKQLDRLARQGFNPAVAISNRKFASAIKRLSTDVCCSVLVHDDRSNSSSLNITLWVAPIDCPDDGFDPLGVGYKILLGGSFDPDEEFFIKNLFRIELLLPHLHELASAVSDELDCPELDTYRLQVYRLERELYQVIRSRAIDHQDSSCAGLLGLADEVVQGHRQLDFLEKHAREVTEALLRSGVMASELRDSVLAGKLHFLDPTRQLYAEALAPLATP